MNETNHDDDLRCALRELGHEAERRAPAFQRVWRAACEARAAREENAGRGFAKWALAATAMVIVCGTTALMMMQRPRTDVAVNSREDAAQTARADTEAFDQATPTDFLLAASGDTAAPSVEQLTREINALLSP